MTLTKLDTTQFAFTNRVSNTTHGHQIVLDCANAQIHWYEKKSNFVLVVVLAVLTAIGIAALHSPFNEIGALMSVWLGCLIMIYGCTYRELAGQPERFCKGQYLSDMESRLDPTDLQEWRQFARVKTKDGEPIRVSDLIEFGEKLAKEAKHRRVLMEQSLNRVQ